MNGSLEHAAKKRARRGELERIVLRTISGAGIVTFGLMAPNALQLLKYVNPDWIEHPDSTRRLREVAYRLRKKGMVRFQKEKNRTILALTSTGKKYLEKSYHFDFTLPKNIRWDGSWRIIVFDIPEKQRRLRDRVRELVTMWGFVRLQDSVWVYPYDCEELITLLKTDLHLGVDLRYIIASAIEFDAPLREHFKLPKTR